MELSRPGARAAGPDFRCPEIAKDGGTMAPCKIPQNIRGGDDGNLRPRSGTPGEYRKILFAADLVAVTAATRSSKIEEKTNAVWCADWETTSPTGSPPHSPLGEPSKSPVSLHVVAALAAAAAQQAAAILRIPFNVRLSYIPTGRDHEAYFARHAEPEEAAQRLSSPRTSSFPRPSDPYASKPPPPPPSSGSSTRDDRYGGRTTSPQQSYQSSSSSSRPTGGPSRGSYDDYDRRRPARDSRDDPREVQQRQGSYGSSSTAARHDRPPPSADPYSRTPAPPAAPRPGSEKEGLWKLFRAVDKDSSGHLSEEELSTALINGDYSAFDPHTVKMMIRMFDVDRSGTIDFDEFCGLWGFLTEWRKLFDRFDVDRSGNISYDEFSDALVAFGYRLSHNYVKLLFNTYDVRGRGTLSFDLFVQACISLKRMTDVFKKYDSDRDGYITLSL
ncbi:hypothetical protein FH972_025824 [Carpinus fangiana]|uniref:EF-hand domain-containing protein n=1 Tax=Carpinus fangiana TaxID=176857 RepID=A0A5N6L2E8_9ROSI|nr:hypothetical protein FH972_025824 [Carpinus fangiana]